MRNIKLTIEYKGTNYAGWQCQNLKGKSKKAKVITIQETIENTLQKILQEKIRLIASGRTDAGVHAQAQVANFKTDSDITFNKLEKALNGLLPEDIAVTKAEEAPLNFHSRFSAKSKVYRYTILNRKNPSAFLRDTVYFYPLSLNIKLMQRESRALLGRHNFKSFQASDNIERNPVRTIKKLKITKEKKLIYIDIEADGFLYNMVRNIIGTLIEIGKRGLSPGSLREILSSQNRKYAGSTAPACGLCLLKVKY
jgi:tRNA pseudouridine38-40 synthase